MAIVVLLLIWLSLSPLGLVLLAGILILRPSRAEGMLEIDTQDESIEVTIKQADGRQVVVVVDKNNKRTVELTPGAGEISAR